MARPGTKVPVLFSSYDAQLWVALLNGEAGPASAGLCRSWQDSEYRIFLL